MAPKILRPDPQEGICILYVMLLGGICQSSASSVISVGSKKCAKLFLAYSRTKKKNSARFKNLDPRHQLLTAATDGKTLISKPISDWEIRGQCLSRNVDQLDVADLDSLEILDSV